MNIQPKIRGFICTTAHPTGCMQHVAEQIQTVKQTLSLPNGPKKVLIIGASTGYGLASRIASAFGANAKTIGVFFEKPAEGKRTASAGWYNSAAFERKAMEAGLYAKSINGDAFSDNVKAKTIQLIEQDWDGEVDLVVYSVASPRRVHPKTGEVYNSVLKPIGQPYTSKTVDVMTGVVSEITLEPASQLEIDHTIKVMGGEDWEMWLDALLKANVLAKGVKTIAYSYIGPSLTYPIYREGAIGQAKAHLEATAKTLTQKLQSLQGEAFVSVNKALVTQASAAIPVVPLYISLLYKIMKEHHLHEGCIEQICRLFKERLYANTPVIVDENGLIRLDDWEMKSEIQDKISAIWPTLSAENIETMTDLKGYRHEFHRLFGFDMSGVNYSEEVDPNENVPSLALEPCL
ncbi:MAG: trans-2-enoyl-CoA reductase family protein [Proteobacteria bacterium]|nr:trans-2-enoyl-CoA reductase family protein [Pseudomonadota bacterium]